MVMIVYMQIEWKLIFPTVFFGVFLTVAAECVALRPGPGKLMNDEAI